MPYEFEERDWKRFRTIVPELRERYLTRVNAELSGLLDAEGKSETDRFWNCEKRIQKEARVLRDCLDGHSRSKMTFYLRVMIGREMFLEEDIEGFGEGLTAYLREIFDERNQVG